MPLITLALAALRSPVNLTSDVLIYLVENRDRVVSKDDLIASVWGGRIASDASVSSRIYAARRALGDSGRDQKLIRTVARKGHRFVEIDALAIANGRTALARIAHTAIYRPRQVDAAA